MNYLFYRRIRGPVFLVTFGVTAALAEWDVLGFEKSWPLYLIVFGVLRLAEGAAAGALGQPPLYSTPGNMPFGNATQGYAPYGTSYPASAVAPVPGARPSTALATTGPSPLQAAATTEEES